MKPLADRIWRNPDKTSGDPSCVGEGMRINLEDQFVETLVSLITEVLDVSWKDRNVTERCLKSAIKKDVENYLDAYLNGNLEILIRTMNKELGIKEKVDYGHAVHARFNSIIKKIQKLSGICVDSG